MAATKKQAEPAREATMHEVLTRHPDTGRETVHRVVAVDADAARAAVVDGKGIPVEHVVDAVAWPQTLG
jgi:hypothetical protein